jgi:hypothetical protein
VDTSARQLLEMRRDQLISEAQRLDREKNDRIRVVTSSPSFDPFTHTLDGQVANLISQQNRLIEQIQELDRQLGR